MKPTKRNLLILAAATVLAIASGAANAATVASFDFTTDTSSASLANTTVSNFAATGTAFSTSGRSGSSLSFFTRQGEGTFTGNNYVGITVAIAPGFELNLSALNFNYGNDSITFTSTYSVRTSADNFATPLVGTYSTNPLTNTGAGSNTTPDTASFDLTGSAFQDLTGSFEVRIYALITSAPGFEDARINRYDNVILTGTVIPEPSTALLGGLGVLALLRRRRS